MSAAKRRRRQMTGGNKHLARICGKSVKGGRPIYRRRALVDVGAAIARERAKAQMEAKRKAKKK